MAGGIFRGSEWRRRNDLMNIAGVRRNPGSGCESYNPAVPGDGLTSLDIWVFPIAKYSHQPRLSTFEV